MRRFIFVFFVFLMIPAGVKSQTPAVSPHAEEGKETGIIQGVLFSIAENGKRKILPSHKVTIIISRQGRGVLTLDKETDDKGHFNFKNIFSDPDFSYALGAIFDKKMYVVPDIKLKKGEMSHDVEFRVGEESPYEIEHDMAASMGSGMDPGGKPIKRVSHSAGQAWSDAYRDVAVALSIIVILLGGYYYFKKA